MVHRMLFWRKTDSLFYHLLSVYLNPNPILPKNTNVFKCQLFFSKMFEDSRCIFAMSDNEFLSGEENGEERELASCFLQSPIREVPTFTSHFSKVVQIKFASLQVCKARVLKYHKRWGTYYKLPRAVITVLGHVHCERRQLLLQFTSVHLSCFCLYLRVFSVIHRNLV